MGWIVRTFVACPVNGKGATQERVKCVGYSHHDELPWFCFDGYFGAKNPHPVIGGCNLPVTYDVCH